MRLATTVGRFACVPGIPSVQTPIGGVGTIKPRRHVYNPQADLRPDLVAEEEACTRAHERDRTEIDQASCRHTDQ